MPITVIICAARASGLWKDTIGPAAAAFSTMTLSGSDALASPDDAMAAMAYHFTDGDAGAALRDMLSVAFANKPVDWCVRTAPFSTPRLLVCDMDSTVINCECIDEIADLAGLKPQVSAITEAAMRGDLDFETSLRERVALLAGVRLAQLETVWRDRVRLNPGARSLVQTVKRHGATTALVSGGFTYFTERVAEAAGFDRHQANTLLDKDGVLTGKAAEPLLGRAAKREALEQRRAAIGATRDEVVVIGDGANDLDMMDAAGLAIAYRAKPAVQARAHGRIASGDLRAALHFAGLPPPFEPDV